MNKFVLLSLSLIFLVFGCQSENSRSPLTSAPLQKGDSIPLGRPMNNDAEPGRIENNSASTPNQGLSTLIGTQTFDMQKSLLAPTLEKLKSKPFVFSINPKRDTFLIGNDVLVRIPKNAFETENGNEPEGLVDFQLKEYYSNPDILLNRLTTKSGSKFIETAGMFSIDASYKGEALRIKEGKSLKVEVPEAPAKTDFQLYIAKKLMDGSLDWQATQQRAKSVYLFPYGIGLDPKTSDSILYKIFHCAIEKQINQTWCYRDIVRIKVVWGGDGKKKSAEALEGNNSTCKSCVNQSLDLIPDIFPTPGLDLKQDIVLIVNVFLSLREKESLSTANVQFGAINYTPSLERDNNGILNLRLERQQFDIEILGTYNHDTPIPSWAKKPYKDIFVKIDPHTTWVGMKFVNYNSFTLDAPVINGYAFNNIPIDEPVILCAFRKSETGVDFSKVYLNTSDKSIPEFEWAPIDEDDIRDKLVTLD